MKGSGGFTKKKNTEGGQGQREENNSRRWKEVVIKDKTRLSSPQPTDISLFSPQQGGGQILGKPPLPPTAHGPYWPPNRLLTLWQKLMKTGRGKQRLTSYHHILLHAPSIMHICKQTHDNLVTSWWCSMPDSFAASRSFSLVLHFLHPLSLSLFHSVSSSLPFSLQDYQSCSTSSSVIQKETTSLSRHK